MPADTARHDAPSPAAAPAFHKIAPIGVDQRADLRSRVRTIARTRPVARAQALAYLVFERRDLALQERFLCDFGLRTAEKSEAAVFLRGSGPDAYCVEVRQGSRDCFVGFGLELSDADEFEKLRLKSGSPAIELILAPGGGKRFRLIDPAGFRVDVVIGRADHGQALPPRPSTPVNAPGAHRRVNGENRHPAAPSAVHRLGHLVLQVRDFPAVLAFYMDLFGFIPTDVQFLDDGEPNLSFNRLDRGAEPTDHHSLVIAGGVTDAFEHCAFEVADLDDVGQGQQFLKMKGWRHAWGIGRHWLGSQIFDYWRDPAGDHFEHYADGDVYDARAPTRYSPLARSTLYQWGADLPPAFGGGPTPSLMIALLRGLMSGALSKDHIGMVMRAMKKPARPWLT
ncbi:MAG: VOC family protein [Parvularculaceae bacterium]|nr:VOC family protein [Parvularculaceae bacterium]